MFDHLRQDVRFGFRSWRRRPGLAAVALVTLALGIGVNTAMFSIVNAVLVRPLPFRHAERLVLLWARTPTAPQTIVSFAEFQVLLALAEEDRHGYGIMQEAERLSGGEIHIEPGTLYRALHRMLEAGWVAEAGRRPPPSSAARNMARADHDERRRYYRLTPLGRRVASAEAERLARLVAAARTSRLLTRA